MATMTAQSETMNFTISIPKVDLKRFKGLAKAMGWVFEKNEEIDETEYVKSNAKIMSAIREGEEAIAAGKFQTTKLEDLWN